MKTNSDKRINLPCALCVAKNIHRYSQHLVMGLIWIKLPVKFLQFRTSSKCSQCCGLLLCNCSLLLCNTLLSPLVEDHQGIVWPHELPSFHDLCDVGLPCPSVWSLSLWSHEFGSKETGFAWLQDFWKRYLWVWNRSKLFWNYINTTWLVLLSWTISRSLTACQLALQFQRK